MKLKKLYTHDNGKQIWRILPTSNKKIVLEERDTDTKEVFFSAIEIDTGKKIFNKFQFEDKNWMGIEAVNNDLIFFHSYGNPEMPTHKSIIAFDLITQSILWQNDKHVFSFLYDDKIYCYQQRFETRKFFALDCFTGEIVKEFEDSSVDFFYFREKSTEEFEKLNYIFPEYFNRNDISSEGYRSYLQNILSEKVIKGEISYLLYNDLLIFNYHEISEVKTFNNILMIVDLTRNKVLLKNTLDKNLVNLMPESFFIKDNYLFLIVDKKKLEVYQINN